MKRCYEEGCTKSAELILDGDDRVVSSYSATFDKARPTKIRTHYHSDFCYFHGKKRKGLL